MLHLYDYLASGNGYKVRLALRLLGRPYRLTELDILKGETRTPAFLAKNPNGRIPALELEDGTVLWESNAILFYLADGTRLLPTDRLLRAQVLQWMFFEQYSHEPYIAVMRFWLHYTGLDEDKLRQRAKKMEGGYAALAVMESRLAAAPYFVGGALSIADLALYAYTHVAHEGEFDLGRFPAIRAWLARIAAEPGYAPITAG
ncbi:MAG: glutathione S-transferase family protein [Alphaproteobacteria bacterium]|nr:glutathione S-transferase family protein [Alphaproteobacteria bacterium]